MLFNQLFLAAGAAALLVVPEVSEADRDIISTLPMPIAADAAFPAILEAQSVSLPCQECNRGDGARVEMGFSVEDGTKLMLNGFELYPSADPWHADLVAEVSTSDTESKEQTLGYGLLVRPEAVDEHQHLALIVIDLQVLEVGGQFVSHVPKVTVKLIKAPSGKIIIGSVNVEEREEAPASGPHHGGYHGAMSRMKDKLREFFAKLKGGCGRHGRKGKHEEGEMHMFEGKRPGHGHGPIRHDSPHHHRVAHHGHEWSKLLKNIAANIVLPVLAGITAGVSVAVMAMGLCSLFALVFHARRRSRRRAAARSKAAATEAGFAEEKAGLMEAEAEDVPPRYEDEEQSPK